VEKVETFYKKTDNKFLPNTHENWEQFHWWMHFMGGRCLVVAWHLYWKEMKKKDY